MDVDKDDQWKLGGKNIEVGELFIGVLVNKQFGFNEEPTNHRRMEECCSSRKTRWEGD